jgi:AraC family transcriptional regulator
VKVMVIVKASKGSEAYEMPSTELLAAMGKYNEALVNAGILLSAEGLHPSCKGVRVRFSGQDRTVTDGPFAETKELIAGYWLWRVNSIPEAIDWVKKCPNPMNEDSDIEIRQVFEADDFGAEFTTELREQESAIRAKAVGLNMPTFQESAELRIAGLSRH